MRLGFIVAGVQRAGTTSLWAMLRQHPDLNLPARKETHFFDNEQLDWHAPDYGLLHREFKDVRPGQILGEATPITFYWTPAQARAFAHNPDLKIILIFRDPIERAVSGWRLCMEKGWETVPFSEAIRAGRSRVLAETEQPGFSRYFSSVERGFYGRQLREMLKLFRRENMLLLQTAELAADPQGLRRRITDFLEIEPFAPLLQERLNASVDPFEIDRADAAYLASLYRDDLADFASLSGLDVSGWRTARMA